MRGNDRVVLFMLLAALWASPAVAQAAPVSVGHSGWSWGNPQPQGNTLTRIDFAGDRGYAVGAFGTLLRTDDGGSTWVGLRTAERADYTHLRVLGPDTVVFGSACALRRSDDGGASFRQLRFSAGRGCQARVAAFHFPTGDVGYLIRENASVLRTPDGGRTFASTAPVPTAGRRPNDAFFTTPDSGIVVEGSGPSGRIHRTTNSGADWTQVASESRNLLGAVFANTQTGYVVGDGNTVLKTTDGGATWTQKPVSGVGGVFNLTSIRCADPSTCLITTDGRTLLLTTDGGETYEAVTAGFRPLAAAFAAGTRAVAVGEQGATALSNDRGETFTRQGGDITEELTVGLGRLRATSPLIAHATGPAGAVARTTDGGASWSLVGVATANAIADVSFSDAANGYALDSSGGVFGTDNGGISWRILDSGTSERPHSLVAADPGTVLLVMPRGLRRSADAGERFEPVSGGAVSRAVLADVDTTDRGVLFAYGKRALLFSTNKGERWTPVRRPGRSSIVDADFATSTAGWVLTADGRVWNTRNRGRRWTEVRSTGSEHAFALAFGSSSNGFLAVAGGFGSVDGGWVLRTSDGGRTWRPQLVSRPRIDDLAAAGPLGGFALAGGRQLFGTPTGGDAADDSQLRLRAARPDRRGRVRVSGTLSPASAGERVIIATRDERGGRWAERAVETNSAGRFSALYRFSRPTLAVAQWAGNESADGDGSPLIRIRGRR